MDALLGCCLSLGFRCEREVVNWEAAGCVCVCVCVVCVVAE